MPFVPLIHGSEEFEVLLDDVELVLFVSLVEVVLLVLVVLVEFVVVVLVVVVVSRIRF